MAVARKWLGEGKEGEEKSERSPRPRNGESIAAIVFHHEGLFADAKNRNEAAINSSPEGPV